MPVHLPVEPSEWLVNHAGAAEVLARPDQARLLKPFMRGECTVAQAAAELGLTVEAMHYRVTRFVQAGLLQVTRLQPRRGRPCKLYRAVSSRFRIPAGLLTDTTLLELTAGAAWEREMSEVVERQRLERAVQSVTVHLSAKGALEWGFHAPEPDWDCPVADSLQLLSAALFLDDADAEAFAGELIELYRRYDQKRGGKRYGFRLNLVPLDRPVDVEVEHGAEEGLQTLT